MIEIEAFDEWALGRIPQLQWYSTQEELEVVVKLFYVILGHPGPAHVEQLDPCKLHNHHNIELTTKLKELDAILLRQLLFYIRQVRAVSEHYVVQLAHCFFTPIFRTMRQEQPPPPALQLPCLGVADFLAAKETPTYLLARALSQLIAIPWTTVSDKVCVTPGPTTVYWKGTRVHNSKGPAVKFADWPSMYFLNGVKVPDWLVNTSEGDLDPRKLLELNNAEIRREFVRKVGIERVCYSLKAVVRDKVGNYELLLLFLKGNRARPYLKMLNPSIGTWHVEGVPQHITTVEQALNWRNQTKEEPEVLT